MSFLCEKEGKVKREHGKEETIEFEFVAGLRRGGKLLYMLEEKQLYVFKVAWNMKRNSNRRVKKYICYEKGCKASVAYMEEENVCKRNKTVHSHASTQEERRKNFDFINACKNAAVDALDGQSLQDVYNNTLNNNLIEKPPLSYAKIKRTLYRLRKDSITPKREISEDFKVKIPSKAIKIAKHSTEDFPQITFEDSDEHYVQDSQYDTLQDALALKTDVEPSGNFQNGTSMEIPSPESLHQSNSGMHDANPDDLSQPTFEEIVVDDKTQMQSTLNNILLVQEKILAVERKKLQIEEKRLAIEERRLAIEEKRLAIEEKRLKIEEKYKHH